MMTSQARWEYCRFEEVLGKGFVAAKLVLFTDEGEKIESFVAAPRRAPRRAGSPASSPRCAATPTRRSGRPRR